MVRPTEGSTDHQGHGPLFMKPLEKAQPWGQEQLSSGLGGREAGPDCCWKLLGAAQNCSLMTLGKLP